MSFRFRLVDLRGYRASRFARRLAVVACLGGLTPACASAPGDESVASSGSVEAALSAVGPDGATYALPSTTTLTLTGATTATLPISSTLASESFSVPAGTYGATLSQGVADAGTTWTLTRSASGSSTTVQAILTDTMPLALTVVKGETTPLTFHFAIDSLGNVTFGTGTVNTGIQVDAGAFPVSTAKITGTASLTAPTLHGSTAFDHALQFSGTASVPYVLSLTRTGAWTSANDEACAAVSVVASSTAANAALGALVDEVSTGSGDLCFGDPNVAGRFSLTLHRTGTPRTATILAVLPSGGTFDVTLEGFVPGAFDGTTLDFATLGEPFTVAEAQLSEVVSASGAVLAEISSAPTGTASVTLHP
jgi:hypothetical protein